MLPASSPEVPGYHFFDFYESALHVGGDYYDYVLLPEDRFAVVVGDVAGKGVSAGILMAKLSSDVRFWLVREPDAAKAMDSGTMTEIEAMPKDTALAFICHIGNRSQVAAEHFRKQGFSNVSNVEGGIDAWAKEIDTAVPEYGGFK